jgi:hypothetical protein
MVAKPATALLVQGSDPEEKVFYVLFENVEGA